MMSLIDMESAFADALAAAGLAPRDGGPIPADGSLHRYRLSDDKPGRRNGWARLYGDGLPHGSAGSWRSGTHITWTPENGDRVNVTDRARFAAIRRQREIERAGTAARAAAKAAALYTRLTMAPGNHPYLIRKQVAPGPCKINMNTALVVPVYDARTRDIVSLQFIRPDGEKRFLAGGRTAGGCCVLGDLDGDDPLVLAEGYATAASIREATGWPVVMAFNAGNLPPVAKALRKRFPARDIIMAADNDMNTEGNPGVAKATEAARAVGALLAVPPDAGDFNDMCIKLGSDAVHEIIEAAERPGGEVAAPEAPTGDEIRVAVKRLTAMEREDYLAARKSEAKRLDVPAGELDRLVAKARGDDDHGEQASGVTVLFAEPEPWPQTVDGAELLDAIVETLTSHVILSPAEANAVALWVVHAHAHDTATISPILATTSPTPECGKTTTLIVIGALVPKPLPASNITAASLFRAVEKWGPTILVDEADTFLRDSDELRGILNSGHNRAAAYVIRTVGDNHEPRHFRTWAPKAIALIGKLPPTLASRSIHIELRRMGPGETVKPLRPDRLHHLERVTRQAARWAADHDMALREAEPNMPATLTGRRTDNWRHLIAIADAAGGNWPERARRAAETLSARGSEQITQVLLLEDIAAIFAETGEDRITSHQMVKKLIEMESRPWPEFKKSKPITPTQVAKLLEGFKIAPNSIRIGTRTPKGYYLAQFKDTFARYLPNNPQHRHNDQETAEIFHSRSATIPLDVADGKSSQPADSVSCGGVADQNPGPADDDDIERAAIVWEGKHGVTEDLDPT